MSDLPNRCPHRVNGELHGRDPDQTGRAVGPGGAAGLWGTLRYARSVEFLVGVAILLTLLAVWFREPLTSANFIVRPTDAGKLYTSYTFDDTGNGGTSVALLDPHRPLDWTCRLSTGFAYPYCGFGLRLDLKQNGHGFDLGRYERIDVDIGYHGGANAIRVLLKDHALDYVVQGKLVDKPNQASFPIRRGEQVVPMNLADFGVADWWKEQTKAPPRIARPSFGNIVGLEFVTGADAGPGIEQIRIRSIILHRHWIGPEAWYAGIGALWLIFIQGILLYRRRQIAQIRRSGELALRESELLYRSILETSTDIIVLLSPDGIVELVNGPGVAAMELDSADRVRGKHWSRLWRGESAATVAAQLNQAIRGEVARFRAPCATSKGTRKWWDVVVAPMCDDQGTLKALLTISRDITSEREKSDRLKWASEHDSLTQLPNRGAFQSRLQAATLRAMETGAGLGLLLVDLDHFKHINDTLGHSAGDEFLKIVAERLRNGVRGSDFVARIGGDEFAILLEGADSEDLLSNIGAEVLARIHAPIRTGGRATKAGASIGGAIFPIHAQSANDLLKRADMAVYVLKENGRGGMKLFNTSILEEAEKSASQITRARTAVSRSTVIPLYQPKIDLESGRVVGVEALLRWKDARRRLQLPSTVEEAFKDYELAAKIGELMQRKVADDVRQWLDCGIELGRVSINAAPAEFLRDDYTERLLTILAERAIPPQQIEVEVTEHAFLGRGPEYVARALRVLKSAGIAIALDDFGTGCSSLSHLRDFPVDVVKIDKSFVQQMTDNPEIASIVAGVIRLAQSLNIETVAEGLETAAQRDLLRVMGCRIAQGHLFSPALPAEEVIELFPKAQAAAA